MSRRAAATGSPRPSDLVIDDQHDLLLIESPDGDGVFNPDGTVNMVIVRPCDGLGPGARIYEASMLEREAPSFAGLSMYDNHDSPAAKKARGHMPRPVRDLAGVIAESWWDPEFSTNSDDEHGWGQGAVIGRCRLTPSMRAIVEAVPEAVKTSMRTVATGGKFRQRRDGKRGLVVEGFANDPAEHSVDLVTRAGAGGRVAAILEAEQDAIVEEARAAGIDVDELPIEEALSVYGDDELAEYLAEHRPQMTTTPEGGEMDVQEALRSDEARAVISEAVTAAIAEARPAIEEAVRGEIRQEIAGPERLRRLARKAAEIVEAARLPRSAADAVLADYAVVEADGRVTAARGLAVIEAVVGDDGNVERTDEQVLEAALKEDIDRQVAVLREARPSVPWSPGTGAAILEGEDGEPSGEFLGNGSPLGQRLRRSGMNPALFGAPATKREAA